MPAQSAATTPARRAPKSALPRVLDVHVTLVHPGGWTLSGALACTYEEHLRGRVEVITRGHLYHWENGRDLYPTQEQFEALRRGETVTFGMKQWD